MKKFVKRAVISFSAVTLLAAGLGLVWLRSTDAMAKDLPQLKKGDIIFQTSRSGQSLAIMLASGSVLSHMGVIDHDTSGNAIVLEATTTTRSTPLQDWINRGAGGRIEIRRMIDLSDSQADAIVREARTHFGKPYDIFFMNGDNALYCSEYVELAFSRGASVQLGASQKVSSLDIDNFAARKIIQQRWQRHPLCEKGGAANFENCYSKILQQSLITPQSIAEDPKLVQIFSNYGVIN
jgi:Permuted papain-like amidase enzyme, YaeF/YiiX, C92 family